MISVLPIKVLGLSLNTDDIEARPQVTATNPDKQLQWQTYAQSLNGATEEQDNAGRSNNKECASYQRVEEFPTGNSQGAKEAA